MCYLREAAEASHIEGTAGAKALGLELIQSRSWQVKNRSRGKNSRSQAEGASRALCSGLWDLSSLVGRLVFFQDGQEGTGRSKEGSTKARWILAELMSAAAWVLRGLAGPLSPPGHTRSVLPGTGSGWRGLRKGGSPQTCFWWAERKLGQWAPEMGHAGVEASIRTAVVSGREIYEF